MGNEEKTICRPDSHSDSPCDAVQMKTECIRSDFTEKPDGEVEFNQMEKSEANMSASMELGYFSIRDKKSGVMLTVAFNDAIMLMAEALDATRKKESYAPKTYDPGIWGN